MRYKRVDNFHLNNLIYIGVFHTDDYEQRITSSI